MKSLGKPAHHSLARVLLASVMSSKGDRHTTDVLRPERSLPFSIIFKNTSENGVWEMIATCSQIKTPCCGTGFVPSQRWPQI